MRRRLLRYALAAVGAFVLVQAIRIVQSAHRTVRIAYEAPPGELHVTIRDAEARVLRRAYFGAAERQHEVDLPAGDFTAQLDVGRGTTVTRPFHVETDGAVLTLRWWDGPPAAAGE